MLDNIISKNDIIKINKDIDSGIVKNDSIESCYSSIYYYDTPELSVSSVFRSLCKNHYFNDGNKRTACMCLCILCEYNDIRLNLSNNKLEKIALEVSNNHYDVDQICKMIFNK